MREIRPSGSVEGVVGNHDPYSDFYQRPASHVDQPNCHFLKACFFAFVIGLFPILH